MVISPNCPKDVDLVFWMRERCNAEEYYLDKIQQAGFKVEIIGEDKEISKTNYSGIALESIKIEATERNR
ncbi:MAG: hypothetical protein NWE95_08810 [Candidatus Bathyarchaeota archaeon]|nr:hypothetical protein [Candidatus Bathyarchaeota archaeon]